MKTSAERGEGERARLLELFQQAPALIGVTRGPQHIFEFVNPPMRELLGATREFLGIPVRQAFPELEGQGFFELLDQVYTTGTPFVGRAIPGRLADWTDEGYFDFVYQPTRTSTGQVEGIFIHAVDVTAQVQAQRELEQRERQASLTADVGEALTKSGTLRTLLQDCTDALVRHLGAAFARIWTLHENEQVLELQASAGVYTHLNGPHGRIPVGQYKIGLIAQERTPHLTNQVVGDPRVSDQAWAQREGMVAFAGYPLLVEERLVGVMALFARQALPDDTLGLLAAIAHMVATGIERKRTDEERDRLTHELQYQLQLNKTITDNAESCLFLMDAKGYPTFMNPAAARVTGYACLDEIRDRPLHYSVHYKYPDGRPYPREECPIDRASEQLTRIPYGEEIFVHRDGSFYPVAYSVAPLEQDGRTIGAVLEFRDITNVRRSQEERERLFAQVQTERQRLFEMFQQAPALIAMLQGPHHVFEVANPRFLQLVGHRPVLGKPIREALPELEGQGFFALLDQVYATGEPYVGSAVPAQIDRHGDGTLEEAIFDFVYQPYRDIDDRVVGILAHAVEVTEQVRARTALAESETRLRLALQAGKMGIWDWSIVGGTITWSDQLESLHGMAPGTFDGQFETWLMRISPDDRERVTTAIQQALADRTLYEAEFRVRWNDGSEHWLYTQGHAFYDDSGRPVRMLGGTFDITARKAAEAALIEEIRTRDDFLAAASHDLKNPLAAVKGTAQMLQRTLARRGEIPPDRLTEGLGNITVSVTQMTAQINELLDVARLRMGQRLPLDRRAVDLVDLVRRQAAVHQAATEHHHLRVETSEAEGLIGEWDAARLERVLDNVIGNAIKYSPDGGEVTVTIAREGEDAVLRVSDHGVGIPGADLRRIFERFQRGSNVIGRIQGTGVGLAATKQIVEQHGGTIAIESTERSGTTVILHLPLTPRAATDGTSNLAST